MRKEEKPLPPIIPVRIFCRRRSKPCWAIISNNPVRRSTPSGCGSTLPIFPKSAMKNCSVMEDIANDMIRKNLDVQTEVCALEDALKTGATAVFDEKYGATVRIVKMGEMSMELCGGTHVQRTGDIGLLKVVHESAIAAGVRRIEAVTGKEALMHVQKAEEELKSTPDYLRPVHWKFMTAPKNCSSTRKRTGKRN